MLHYHVANLLPLPGLADNVKDARPLRDDAGPMRYDISAASAARHARRDLSSIIAPRT